MVIIILTLLYYFYLKSLVQLLKKGKYLTLALTLSLTMFSIYLSYGQILGWPLPPITQIIEQLFTPLSQLIF